ncbi:MAG TPA: 6-carboxytetrahydropterin synthase [Bacillota bacterium]|nr:6-carboxytetrahydropterin synthase [Bacillota bacterium]
MYALKFGSHFDGAHFLRDYDGKCSRVHGPRWRVEGQVSGERLQPNGLLVDFHHLKAWLKECCDVFDHFLVNELEGFRAGELNPTAENLAWYIHKQMAAKIARHFTAIRLDYITVWESPDCAATYSEAEQVTNKGSLRE